jgi:transcriptional regulator with GAF, ATPase, and Fis domain
MCPQIHLQSNSGRGRTSGAQRDCGVAHNEISSCTEIPVTFAEASYMTDLAGLTALATEPSALDEVLIRALTSLERIVPYDLAALYELDGDALTVRTAVGALAGESVRHARLSLARFPLIRQALTARRPIAVEESQHRDDGDPYDGLLDLPPGHACMLVPVCAGPRELGVITLDRMVCSKYDAAAVEVAGVYARIVAMAMTIADQAQRLARYRHRQREENRLLREELRSGRLAIQRVRAWRSAAMRDVARLAEQAAGADSPVLITGETGSGKEVLANAIHAWSERADEPFVTLNCAAIPDNLVESELFGYVRGAFTGAAADRAGRFLAAHGGTLFLDEIGDMPLSVQAKLLRVLQEGAFEPVGSDRTVRVDVRIIAATHLDLEAAVAARRFREDLYFRIAVFPLRVPPLRARPEDLPILAQAILDELAERRGRGRGPWSLTPAAIHVLARQPWPGNVRQLVNVLERAVILQPSGELDVAHVDPGPGVCFTSAVLPAVAGPGAPLAEPEPLERFEDHERRYLRRVLAHTGGKIYGPGGAAELLDLPPTTLQSKLRRYGIR